MRREANVKQGAPLTAKGRALQDSTIPIRETNRTSSSCSRHCGYEGRRRWRKGSGAASFLAAGRRCGPGLCADSKM